MPHGVVWVRRGLRKRAGWGFGPGGWGVRAGGAGGGARSAGWPVGRSAQLGCWAARRVGRCGWRWGCWIGVGPGVVAGELADVVAGLGQDREGAAVIPVDVDGGLGGLPNAGDGAAVTGRRRV